MPYKEHDYTTTVRVRRLNVPALKSVNDGHDKFFVHKISNNDLPYPKLTSQFVQRNVRYIIRCPRLVAERSFPRILCITLLCGTTTYQILDFLKQ